MKMEGLNLLASQRGRSYRMQKERCQKFCPYREATPATASILLSDLSSGIQTTVTLNADEAKKHITEQSQVTMRRTEVVGKKLFLQTSRFNR